MFTIRGQSYSFSWFWFMYFQRHFKNIVTMFTICWLLIFLFLCIVILFTSNNIEIWPPSLTADGLNLFVKVFSIPIYFIASGVPILGIIITIKRLEQSDKQYRALLRNNYKEHLSDFIETMIATCNNDINAIIQMVNISRDIFLRNLHTIFFGNRSVFDYQLKHGLMENLIDVVLRLSNIERSKNKDFSIFEPLLKQFGIILTKNSFVSKYKNQFPPALFSAIKILESASDFAGTGLVFNYKDEKED